MLLDTSGRTASVKLLNLRRRQRASETDHENLRTLNCRLLTNIQELEEQLREKEEELIMGESALDDYVAQYGLAP